MLRRTARETWNARRSIALDPTMTSLLQTPPSTSRVRVALCVALAVLCGAGVALQSRINGQLGTDLGNGFVAALISFGSGLVIVTIALAFSKGAQRGIRNVTSAIRSGEIPWWHTAGGLGGG